jgi:glutamine amidotransferase PdxT
VATPPRIGVLAGPILGTCAGMSNHLGPVDVEVDRNTYGRQTSSFDDLVKEAASVRPL